jgi:hypothetical protein
MFIIIERFDLLSWELHPHQRELMRAKNLFFRNDGNRTILRAAATAGSTFDLIEF